MRFSHSKLSLLLKCPMSYYLSYKQKICLKTKKPALAIGEAVHWGIEHNTEDLTEFYNQQGGFFQRNNYTDEQLLSEAMIHSYLINKEKIFNELLLDENEDKLELLEETHELELIRNLNFENDDSSFLGIIDLLLLTNKGFILVDYKTSGSIPNWDDYLDQIYRYIYLLKGEFPDIPIYKIAIINLRKTKIRRKTKESEDSFRLRLWQEYDKLSDEYVHWHIYETDKLNKEHVQHYAENLEHMCKAALSIDENKLFFINFSEAIGKYGRGDYYDIFYQTENNHLLYKIKDEIWDDETQQFSEYRDCLPIDMQTINLNLKILNKYENFKLQLFAYYNLTDSLPEKEEFNKYLKENFICDDSLLELYWNNLLHEKIGENDN